MYRVYVRTKVIRITTIVKTFSAELPVKFHTKLKSDLGPGPPTDLLK